jgi:hypothetical protein
MRNIGVLGLRIKKKAKLPPPFTAGEAALD